MYKEYEARTFPQTDQDNSSDSFPFIDVQFLKSYKQRRRLGKGGRHQSLNSASDLMHLDKKNHEFIDANQSSGQHSNLSGLMRGDPDYDQQISQSPMNFLRAKSGSSPPPNSAVNKEMNSAVKNSTAFSEASFSFDSGIEESSMLANSKIENSSVDSSCKKSFKLGPEEKHLPLNDLINVEMGRIHTPASNYSLGKSKFGVAKTHVEDVENFPGKLSNNLHNRIPFDLHNKMPEKPPINPSRIPDNPFGKPTENLNRSKDPREDKNYNHIDLKFHQSAPFFLSSQFNNRTPNVGVNACKDPFAVGSSQKPAFMFSNPPNMNQTYTLEKNLTHPTLSACQEELEPLNLSQHHDSVNTIIERLQIDSAPKLSSPELANNLEKSSKTLTNSDDYVKQDVFKNVLPTSKPENPVVNVEQSKVGESVSQNSPSLLVAPPPCIQKEPSENPFKRPADVGLVKGNLRSQAKVSPPASSLNITRSNQGNQHQVVNQNAPQQSKTFENDADLVHVNSKPYKILSLLGKGGTSKVYLVLDLTSNQLKAIKCVYLSKVDDIFAKAYLNEIELLIKLQECKTVIRMFDHEYIENERLLYVVLEKGDTDFARLIRNLPKEKDLFMICYYWREILNAVRDIHDRGIIHSDLKPSNFLLVEGRLKLIDFGIASSLPDDMTSVYLEVTCGTINYMSPEAIPNGGANKLGYKITCRSDVWSLGCILYNLVYGRTPFSHLSRDWIKMQAIVDNTHKIEFPDQVQDWKVPPFLIECMKKCLNREPKQRPTVGELLISLNNVTICDITTSN